MSNAESFSTEWEIIQRDLGTDECGKKPESPGVYDYEITIEAGNKDANPEEEKTRTFLQKMRDSVDNYICVRLFYAMSVFSSAALAACEPVDGPPCVTMSGYTSECPSEPGSDPLSSEGRRLTSDEIMKCVNEANTKVRFGTPDDIVFEQKKMALDVYVVAKPNPDPNEDPDFTPNDVDDLVDGINSIYIDTEVSFVHDSDDTAYMTYDFSSFDTDIDSPDIDNPEGVAKLVEFLEPDTSSVTLVVVLDSMPAFDGQNRLTRGLYDPVTDVSILRVGLNFDIDYLSDAASHELGHKVGLEDAHSPNNYLITPYDPWPNDPDGCEWGGCNFECANGFYTNLDGLDIMGYRRKNYDQDCTGRFSEVQKHFVSCTGSILWTSYNSDSVN